MENDMFQKNIFPLMLSFVAILLWTIIPCNLSAKDGIMRSDNGRYTIHPPSITESTWKTLAQDDNLQAINFYCFPHWEISESLLHELCKLTKLRRIFFGDCQNLNAEVLRAVKELPNLRDMGLTCGHNYSEEFYNELSTITQLKEFYIFGPPGTSLSNETVTCLSRMTGLTGLYLYVIQPITPQQIEELTPLKNLKILKLLSPPSSDSMLQSIGKFQSLQELQISWIIEESPIRNISDKRRSISSEEKSAWEKEHHSYMEPITQKGIQALATLQNLRILRLTLPLSIKEGDLDPLFTLSALESLILKADFRDSDIRNISQLTNLKELYLSSYLMTGSAIKYLAKLKRLQSLKLEFDPNAPVVSEELSTLSTLKLREISLSGNSCINDEAIGVLAKFPHLNYIDLYDTNVSKRYRKVFIEEGEHAVKDLFQKKKMKKKNNNNKDEKVQKRYLSNK